MDRQDVTILARLFEDPRAPADALGRQVGLSGNAVKARLKRLEEAGVLQGFAALPAPGLLGVEDGLLVFTGVDDAPEREQELLTGLPEVPGVRLVDVGTDRSVYVWLLPRDEADWERVERAVVSLVGKPPSLRLRAEAPAPAASLAPADWKLAQALVGRGRLPLKETAARAGLSFKTAKRRLARLLGERLLRIEPILSPAEASGLVLYTVVLHLREGARWDEVPLPEGAVLSGTPGGRLAMLHGAAATLREAQAAEAGLRRCAALERALLVIPTRRASEAALSEALQRRLTPAEAPAAVPVPLLRTSK